MAYLETATRRLIVRFRGSVGLGVSSRIGKQCDEQTSRRTRHKWLCVTLEISMEESCGEDPPKQIK